MLCSMQPFAELLPATVVAPGTAVGSVTEEAAQQTGLPTSCSICAGTTGMNKQLLSMVTSKTHWPLMDTFLKGLGIHPQNAAVTVEA